MKKFILLFAFAAAVMAGFTACTSQRMGCKATQGMRGY